MVFELSRISLHEEGEAGSLNMDVVMKGRVSNMVLCDRIAVAIVVMV